MPPATTGAQLGRRSRARRARRTLAVRGAVGARGDRGRATARAGAARAGARRAPVCTTGSSARGWAAAPAARWASPSRAGRARTIRRYLQRAGAYPIDGLPPAARPAPDGFPRSTSWPESTRGRIAGVPRDDDIDYTILGLHVLETHGRGFTTARRGGRVARPCCRFTRSTPPSAPPTATWSSVCGRRRRRLHATRTASGSARRSARTSSATSRPATRARGARSRSRTRGSRTSPTASTARCGPRRWSPRASPRDLDASGARRRRSRSSRRARGWPRRCATSPPCTRAGSTWEQARDGIERRYGALQLGAHDQQRRGRRRRAAVGRGRLHAHHRAGRAGRLGHRLQRRHRGLGVRRDARHGRAAGPLDRAVPRPRPQRDAGFDGASISDLAARTRGSPPADGRRGGRRLRLRARSRRGSGAIRRRVPAVTCSPSTTTPSARATIGLM